MDPPGLGEYVVADCGERRWLGDEVDRTSEQSAYVALYVASNYGFIVIVWKFDSAVRGVLMLALSAVQLVANLVTHPPRVRRS